MVFFGSLTNLEIQILIYITHTVVNSLNIAREQNKNYDCEIDPEELLHFLHKFKIDIQNNSVSIDGKSISDNYNGKGTGEHSSYSIMQSQYSNFSEDFN